MTPFSHLSFLRKLTWFVLAATVFALVTTFVALTLYESSSFRQARHNESPIRAQELDDVLAHQLNARNKRSPRSTRVPEPIPR